MSDEVPDEVTSLAEEYLDSLDDDGIDGNAEDVREELEYWQEQVDEFEEGSPMHEMAVEERDEWRERLDAIESQGELREELRNEVLTLASTNFAPQGEWIKPTVIEALSQALTGQRQEQLLVDEFSLPSDADDMSKRDMVSVAKTVHTLALDALEGDDRVPELWDKLSTDTQHSIIRVLAAHGEPLSSSQISDELGDDGTDNPGANIRYLRGEVDIDPYYSMSNGYTLSLVGRYVWKEFGEDLVESEEGERDEGQTTIDDRAEQPKADGDEGKSMPSVAKEGSEDEEDSEAEDSNNDMDLSSFEIRE